MAAHPTLSAGGQFGGEHEDQFDIGTLGHVGLGIEEYAVGTDVAGLGRQLSSPDCALNANGHASKNSLAGTAIDRSVH
jgi:hypothetical protein